MKMIGYRVERETVAFPREIVVMRNRGQPRFGNHLRHGQTQGNMHRDGEDVLRDKHLGAELIDETIEFILQQFLDRMKLVRDGAAPDRDSKYLLVEHVDFWMTKVSHRRGVSQVRGGIGQPRHPKALVLLLGKDLAPFLGLECHTVRPVESCGNKADAPGRSCGKNTAAHAAILPGRLPGSMLFAN